MANFLTRHFNFLSNREMDAEIEAVFGTFAAKVAFKALAVHIATSYIADALSGCEFKVVRGGEEVHDWLYYRLNVSPNPNQSGSQFKNEVVSRLLREQETLIVPHRNDALYIADSYGIDRRPTKDDVFTSISIERQPISKRYRASDAYFLKLGNTDVRGLIDSLYDDYATLIAAAIEGFKQSHGRKYKLKLDQVKVGDDEFADNYEKVVKKQLKEFLENENAVYPQYAGYDLEEMRHESDGGSADILAMRKEVFDIAAQAYKIPISMMYGNTNNTNDVLNQFLTFAVDPIATLISDELTRKSFTFWEWGEGSYVSVDTKRINHVDIFNVADKVDKLISSGVFSIDAVLTELDYQPLNTKFSQAHYITKNYELAEDAMNRLGEGGEK